MGFVKNNQGKYNTTTVPGNARVPLQATDGTINIVVDDVTARGAYHPSGAIRVNSATNVYVYDNTGAFYSNHILGNQT